MWHTCYNSDPTEFSNLQNDWAYKQYYEPAESYMASIGVPISNRSDSVKSLCWGMANLFGTGGWKHFVSGYWSGYDWSGNWNNWRYWEGAGLTSSMSDAEFIEALCNYVVNNVSVFYKAQPQYWAGWQNRYRSEKEHYLEAIGADKLAAYSAVFDPTYYFENYPDIKVAFGNDSLAALNHFLTYGMREGRRGNSTFDVLSYYNEYEDLRAAYGTDIASYYEHYRRWGLSEGRHPSGCTETVGVPTTLSGTDWSPVYDPAYYLASNDDLRAAYSATYGDVTLVDYDALLRHFVSWGMGEGRRASEAFDVASYYNAYEDLRAAYGTDLARYYRHYVTWGRAEGRATSGVPELSSWQHAYGGVDWSPVYDGACYWAAYSDLRAAYTKGTDFVSLVDDGALLRHFVAWGANEGRRANSTFDVTSYYNEYFDLRCAYGKNWISYCRHYCIYGRAEGRHPSGCDHMVYPAEVQIMINAINGYSSNTNWLLAVNNTTNKVGVFYGSCGNWELVYYWNAATGKASTPTVKGSYTVTGKGYSFGSGYTCYYYTQFYGDYLFHSVLYYEDTFRIMDGTLGANASHGCVRLSIDNAKWIYDNIPYGTKVVSY